MYDSDGADVARDVAAAVNFKSSACVYVCVNALLSAHVSLVLMTPFVESANYGKKRVAAFCCSFHLFCSFQTLRVGWNHIYVRCISGIYGRE